MKDTDVKVKGNKTLCLPLGQGWPETEGQAVVTVV